VPILNPETASLDTYKAYFDRIGLSKGLSLLVTDLPPYICLEISLQLSLTFLHSTRAKSSVIHIFPALHLSAPNLPN
jgi:hypothetical protein